jgi:uncharacterized membrane protein YdbT with pleckstrin-like domain
MSEVAGRLLTAGETVVVAMRPHWRRVVPAAAVLRVAAPATTYLAALVPVGDQQLTLRWVLATLGGLVVLRWSAWPFLVWLTTSYVFTTRRVITRWGVVRRHGYDVPLSRVTGLSFSQAGLGDRLARTGKLVVQTGAEWQPLVLTDVPCVATAHRDLYGLVDAAAKDDRDTRDTRGDRGDRDGTALDRPVGHSVRASRDGDSARAHRGYW